jgi:hypothetical protein
MAIYRGVNPPTCNISSASPCRKTLSWEEKLGTAYLGNYLDEGTLSSQEHLGRMLKCFPLKKFSNSEIQKKSSSLEVERFTNYFSNIIATEVEGADAFAPSMEGEGFHMIGERFVDAGPRDEHSMIFQHWIR